MERLTIPDVRIDEKTQKRTIICADKVSSYVMEFYWRLKKIEDILGDTYDLDNLKKMVEAFDNHQVLLIPKEGIKWLYRFGPDGIEFAKAPKEKLKSPRGTNRPGG